MLLSNTLSISEYYQQKSTIAQETFKDHVLWKQEERRWKLVCPYKDGAFNSSFWAEIVALDGGTLLVHGDFTPTIFGYYSGNPESKNDPLAMLRWIGSKPNFTNYLFQKARLGLQGLGKYSTRTFNKKVARWECLEGIIAEATEYMPDWLHCIDRSLLLPEELYRRILTEETLDGSYKLSPGFRDLVLKKECLEESTPMETLDNYLSLFGVDAKGLQEFILNKVTENEVCRCFLEAGQSLDYYYEEEIESGIFYNHSLADNLVENDYDYDYIYDIGFVPKFSLFLAWAACAKALELLEEKS